MATYYVGVGGNNLNAGTSWALRRLTLTSIEGLVAASDTVYVGAGVYREALTTVVSGTSGNVITYIADVTGENTDGVGGIVRISGSDNDTTMTRATGIVINGHNLRTFRGFQIDACSAQAAQTGGGANNIFEDCRILNCPVGISQNGAATNFTMRRCIVVGGTGGAFAVSAGSAGGHVIDACVIVGMGANYGNIIYLSSISSVTIRNNLFIGGWNQINADTGTATVTVQNNIFIAAANFALLAINTTMITESYNKFSQCAGNRSNVTVGTGSVDEVWLPLLPLLSAGIAGGASQPGVSHWLMALSEFDARLRATDSGTANADVYGVARLGTTGKRAWGAVDSLPVSRTTTNTYSSSAAALLMSDAGVTQFVVPVTAVSTTFAVRVRRGANYAGTLPQMILRQGATVRTTTDTGSASVYNQLTDTFTPSATPPYVIVELKSNNTATSSAFEVTWDDLVVT